MKTTLYTLIKTLLLIGIWVCTQSCEKMIEVDLPVNQIETTKVFTDIQTADAAVAALYGGLWDNSPLAGDQTGKILGIYTDDLAYYSPTATNGLLEIYNNSAVDSNPAVYAYWAAAYQKIYMANAILEGVQASPLADADVKRITSETLFIRSFLFFYLEQIFGDIPLPLTTDYNINKALFKTNSNDVLAKIRSDLNSSIALLSNTYRNPERIYPNKKAAQLLLVKVILAQNNPNKWADAEVVLKDIIQSPLYSFQNDITKVFNKSGTHILWQLKPKNSGDAVKESNVYYFVNAAPTTFALSQDLVNSFETIDRRKQNWMAAVTVGNNTWYRAEKYKLRTNNTSEYSIVFRIEEAYLLLAETLGQQNKIAEAIPFVNYTRQRAGLSPITNIGSQNLFLIEVINEMRREFFTEFGNRFLDLKRLNKLSILQITKPNWKDFHSIFPIPQKDLLLNPNLNPQNAGY